MTVYKLFVKLLWKSKAAILGYIAIFFMFSVLAGRSVNVNDKEFTIESYPVGVVVEQDGPMTQSFMEYLGKTQKVTLEENNISKTKEDILSSKYIAVIYLKEGQSPQIYMDETLRQSRTIYSLTDSWYRYALAMKPFDETKIDEILKVKATVTDLQAKEKNESSQMLAFSVNYMRFLGYLLVAVNILVIGMILVDFLKEVTYIRTRMSPISSAAMYIQSILAFLVLEGFLLVVMYGGGRIIGGAEFINEVTIKSIPMSILFSLCALSLSVMIVSFFRNKSFITSASNVVSLAMAFLTGSFIPMEFMSPSVLKVGKIFPLYYYNMYGKTGDNKNLIIVALYTLVFILLGVFITREKRKA